MQCRCCRPLPVILFHAPQFGFHKLALAYHCQPFFFRYHPCIVPPCISCSLCPCHLFLVQAYLLITFSFQPFSLSSRTYILPALFNVFYFHVERGYFAFVQLEITAGLLCVEHRRHEETVFCVMLQKSRICRKIPRPSLSVLHNEHSEHLSSVPVAGAETVSHDILLHLTRGEQAQRMRLVAEGICELLRLGNVGG